MTGPRLHNHHSTPQESTLDTLSRTIEDLEEKLLGQASGTSSGHSGYEVQPNRDYSPGRDQSLSEEIRARQQSLAGSRRRVGGQSEDLQAPRRLQVKMKNPAKANAPSSQEISGILSQLRRELKQDMQTALRQELGQMQADLSASVSDPNLPASIGADLENIAQSLKQLESGRSLAPEATAAGGELDSLRLEVDSLRSLVDTVAKEDTLVGLDNRWGDIERTLQGFNPHAMHGELADLATRLEDIRHAMASLPQSSASLGPLEEKVELISTAIAQLIDRPERGGQSEQFTQFTNQTDARLAQLADQMELLVNHGEQGLNDRIEVMSARLNDLANDTSLNELEERIGLLQESLVSSKSSEHIPQLNERLLEIANKVDALDGRTASVETAGIERLVSQLADIAQKLDQKSAPVEVSGLDRLEHQLSDIANRLDQSTGGITQVNTDSLQQQITQLSELMSGTNVDEVSDKLANLEEHLNTNDEFVLEAARQAAEATLEAYQGSPNASSIGGQNDGAVMSALTSEMRQLEGLYRASDDRTAQAFEAVQDTLLKIADRLDGVNLPQQFAPTAAPTAVMPKTTPFGGDEESGVQSHLGNTPGISPNIEVFDDSDLIDNQHPAEPLQEKPVRGANSLLAGLAERMKREKSSSAIDEPAPTLPMQKAAPSALDELDSEFADEPLEPGSGAPDINSIMQKVRDVQKQRAMQPGTSERETDPADYVASARRAALAAAAEVGSIDPDETASKRKIRGAQEKGNSLVRKPILIAAGAILLAILAIPLAKNFIGGSQDSDSPQVAELGSGNTPENSNALKAIDGDAGLPLNNDTDTPIEDLGPRIVDAKPDAIVDDSLQVSAVELGTDAISDNALPDTTIIANSEDGLTTQETPATLDVNLFADAANIPASVAPIALKQAALNGDPVALFEIGARYTEGRGTEVQLDNAVKWLKLSSDQNFAPAQYRLGNFYEKGTGVDRDIERAKTLYAAAAGNGNVNAMHNLGVLLASTGLSNDFNSAADWFLQAAERGVRDSQVNMAILYARGEGVQRDLVESYKWFAIAANEGDADAAAKRDEVFNALTPDSANMAREKVAGWKKSPLDTNANNVQIPDSWAGEATNTASIDMKKAVMNIQAILNNNGFDTGKPDGIIGGKTTAAIRAFQASIGMKPDGQISDKLVQELLKKNG